MVLQADAGLSDDAIAQALDIGTATVERIRKRLVEEGLEAALRERPRPGGQRKLDGKQEAFLSALAWSTPPEGRAGWTMKVLADRLVALPVVEAIADATVRRTRKKMPSSRGRTKPGVSRASARTSVWHMEDSLALDAAPDDSPSPVVCVDERPYPWVSEVRQPRPAAPGQPVRYDDAYHREGTCHLCMCCEPRQGWRHVKVTDRRTTQDFAHGMKDVVEIHCPNAAVVRVVLDNLNTHPPAARYAPCPPAEACRIVRKLDCHAPPSPAVGSRWPKSSSRWSRPSAWTGGWTPKRRSVAQSPLDKHAATQQRPPLTGASRRQKHDANSNTFTPYKPCGTPLEKSIEHYLAEDR